MLRAKRPGGPRKKSPEIPDNAMGWALIDYLAWGQQVGHTEATVQTRKQTLIAFLRWAAERSLDKPQDITLPILERHQRYLFHYRKADGAPLSYSHQHSQLSSVKNFFQWLTRSRYLLYNPASELQLPKSHRKLPQHVLTPGEVETILAETDIGEPSGLRDRAMLELLYSTGVRRLELMHLKCYDLDTQAGSLFVRQGKGRRDRMLPVGERACAWLAKYLADVRPLLLAESDSGHLFLTDYGAPLNKHTAGSLVRRYIDRAGFTFQGSCHLFRHAMATHMLENGADIRYIQVMLGHAQLTTTEVYTQVSILKLKQVHNATHPARLKPLNAAAPAQTSTDVKESLLEALNAQAVEHGQEPA